MQVVYPKQTDKPLYRGLVTQCQALGIPLTDLAQLAGAPLSARADVVLDALFGFSFGGAPRPPFDQLLAMLAPAANPPPIVSVDLPSGACGTAGDGG